MSPSSTCLRDNAETRLTEHRKLFSHVDATILRRLPRYLR